MEIASRIMSEQFGCEIEEVWLTIGASMVPLFISLFFEPPLKFFLWSFLIVGYLLFFTPFQVLTTEEGLTIRSLTRYRKILWREVIRIKYSRKWRFLVIRSSKGNDIIPFGIWLSSNNEARFFSLLATLSTRIPEERFELPL